MLITSEEFRCDGCGVHFDELEKCHQVKAGPGEYTYCPDCFIPKQQAEIDRLQSELAAIKAAVARAFNAPGEDGLPEGKSIVGLIESMDRERYRLNDELAEANAQVVYEQERNQNNVAMNTDRAREIAEALGAQLIEGDPANWKAGGWWIGDTFLCHEDQINNYLDSAKGQQRMRDRVDELWLRVLPHRNPPRVARYATNSLSFIELQEIVNGRGIVPLEAQPIATNAEALLWLDKQRRRK